MAERPSEDSARLGLQPRPQNGDAEQRANTPESRRSGVLASLDMVPWSKLHVKIFFAAGIGFLTDAYDIFAITIVVEMLDSVYGPLLPWQVAGLKMATPIGNLFGQLLFGPLADIFGRKRMYGIELMIMIIATFAQAVSGAGPHLNIVNILIFWRIIMGIGVGGDYPLSAIIASEFASTTTRGRLMTAVFSFQGWGQLLASLVGIIVVTAFGDSLTSDNVDIAWRILIGFGSIPAAFVLYFRLTLPETPRYSMDVELKVREAEHAVQNAPNNRFGIWDDDATGSTPALNGVLNARRASIADFVAYFSQLKNLRVLFGTAYSWFALDVSFYILTLNYYPILSLLFPLGSGSLYQSLYNLCVLSIILAVAGLIPGFGVAYIFIDTWGRKSIQLMGFVILTILFWAMSFGYDRLISQPAFMGLYCLSNFFQNFGPNTTTFILPGEVFPTRYRSTAHGISAAFGKLGAVVALISFTVAQQRNDIPLVLKVLSFVMVTGVFSTLLIPETKKKTLEAISNEDPVAQEVQQQQHQQPP